MNEQQFDYCSSPEYFLLFDLPILFPLMDMKNSQLFSLLLRILS